MRWSEASDGAWLSCSISEMVALVTPARLASSRCDRPAFSHTTRSRAPTASAEAWLSARAERNNFATDFAGFSFTTLGEGFAGALVVALLANERSPVKGTAT